MWNAAAAPARGRQSRRPRELPRGASLLSLMDAPSLAATASFANGTVLRWIAPMKRVFIVRNGHQRRRREHLKAELVAASINQPRVLQRRQRRTGVFRQASEASCRRRTTVPGFTAGTRLVGLAWSRLWHKFYRDPQFRTVEHSVRSHFEHRRACGSTDPNGGRDCIALLQQTKQSQTVTARTTDWCARTRGAFTKTLAAWQR